MTPRFMVAGAVLLSLSAFGLPRTSGGRAPVAVVRDGPFTELLIERGTVAAARMELYGSSIPGAQAKILELAPEGSSTSADEVLIRFDRAPFEEAVARESGLVAQAEAELVRAREDLKLEEMRAGTDTDAAREQVTFAESALASEREGKGPVALAEAETAARDATRQLERASAAAADMRALLKDSFVTRIEASQAEDALEQARDRARVANLKLATLREFDRPAAIDKSMADVMTARKGAAAATEAARARLAQRRAAVALGESRLLDARQRLSHARDQLDRTVVRSRGAGLVVYRQLFFGSEKRKPQPGDEVWPNQPIVAVPDPAEVLVETRVRELDLHKVTAGQAVRVSVDAYPGLSLPAAVVMIGALALEDAARPGAKYFPVTVRIAHTDPRLRTGMTARLEVEVASIQHATLVPVEAIVEQDGVTRCYVTTAGAASARVVRVRARNRLVAAIDDGLSVGESVLLAAPGQTP